MVMHNIRKISALLALCLLLSGCAGTATDEAAFGGAGGEHLYTRTATDEEAFGFPEGGAAGNGMTAQQPASGIGQAPLEEPETVTPEDGAIALQPVSGTGQASLEESETVTLEDGAIPLAAAPMLLPVATGTAVESGGGVEIDYSNISDGYVMVRHAGANSKRLRVQVAGPNTTYTYDLPTGGWVTYPLSDGNGSYKVTALQNTEGKKYAKLVSAAFQVKLTDEFAPFLRPNQYVDYGVASNTVDKAAELTESCTDGLDKVAKIYDFVVEYLTYDREKAATVKSGYLPVLDTVLSAKKGICFDYAALMTGMLRSQGVPCKLVVGYAGTQYHAWVSVWTEKTGWVDNIIYFDGASWQRMDPTFASSGKSSASIMQYIGDGSNYTVKYLY